MRERVPEFEALGARVVIVGNGQPWHALAFLQDHPTGATLLVDPEMKAYAVAGLRRGIASTLLHPAAIKHGVRALRGGHRQGKMQGDPWQQGGAFVIAPDGHISFSYVSRQAGDHVDPQALLDALPRAPAPAPPAAR